METVFAQKIWNMNEVQSGVLAQRNDTDMIKYNNLY